MHQQIKQDTLWLPVDLALYAERNDLIEELGLYLTLKLSCSGKVHASSKLQLLKKAGFQLTQRQTFNKRLASLIERNWVGYNHASGYYFIRSFRTVCRSLDLNHTPCVRFQTEHFKQFRVFVFAAVVCHRIRLIQIAKKLARRKKRERRLVPLYWDDGTNQQSDSPCFFNYDGLPSSVIAEMIGKTPQRCRELRQAAHQAGFLINREKKLRVAVMDKNPLVKAALQEQYGERAGRFSVRVLKSGKDAGRLGLIEQLPNEIIPLLEIKKK